nr:porin family protein [uncultured Flavobacterium sp.]
MRKYFAIVVFGLIVSGVSAQISVKPGFKGGLNFSTFTNADADSKTDFYMGGLLAIKIAKIYTLQPEVVYSRQGAIISQVYFSDNFDPMVGYSRRNVKYSVDYLSLGIINKFTFGHGFQAVVGPSLDFKVGDNFRKNYTEEPIGFDLGLIGGIGYSLPNGLTFEARIKQGMVDIFGNNYDEYDDDNNGNYDDIILNQVFQLGVSYTFDIKK